MEKSGALSQLLVVSESAEENEQKEIRCRNGVFGVRIANPWEVCSDNSYLLSGVKKYLKEKQIKDKNVGFSSMYGSVL